MENTTTVAAHAAARVRAEVTPASTYRGAGVPLGGRLAPVAAGVQGSTVPVAGSLTTDMATGTSKNDRIVDARPGPTAWSPPV